MNGLPSFYQPLDFRNGEQVWIRDIMDRVERGRQRPKEWIGAAWDLSPIFQRAEAWTEAQAAGYLGFLFKGGDVQPFTIRRDHTNPMDQVVDGQQRIRAVVGWMEGRLAADVDGTMVTRDTDGIGPLIKRLSFPLRYLTGDDVQVFRAYLLMNSQGVPHTAEELGRVQSLLELAQTRGSGGYLVAGCQIITRNVWHEANLEELSDQVVIWPYQEREGMVIGIGVDYVTAWVMAAQAATEEAQKRGGMAE